MRTGHHRWADGWEFPAEARRQAKRSSQLLALTQQMNSTPARGWAPSLWSCFSREDRITISDNSILEAMPGGRYAAFPISAVTNFQR